MTSKRAAVPDIEQVCKIGTIIAEKGKKVSLPTGI